MTARYLTTRSRKARSRIAIAVVLSLIGVGLAGCATTPSPDPIGARQRAQIRESILDAAWSDVIKTFPDALRPAVRTMHTVTDHDRQSAVFACLRASGIRATATDNGFRYNSSLGQSQIEFAETTYACSAANPAQSDVASYLIPSQRKALFDFQNGVVRPCLLAVGVPSPAPPDGGPSYYLSAALAAWSPYLSVWSSAVRPATLAYLEQRCPPLPGWMDLTDRGISGAPPR